MRAKIQNINDDARLNHWKQIIQECRNSGLPVKTWFRQNDVSEPSYYYYLKKIRQSIIEDCKESKSFFLLSYKKKRKREPKNIVITKGDIHIQVPEDTDFDLLVSMLKVLLC